LEQVKKIRKNKIKFTLEQATQPQRGSRAIALLFSLPLALDGSRWTMPCPSHFVPGKQTQDPFNMGLGGTQDWSGQAQKISPPLRFDPQNHPACSNSLY